MFYLWLLWKLTPRLIWVFWCYCLDPLDFAMKENKEQLFSLSSNKLQVLLSIHKYLWPSELQCDTQNDQCWYGISAWTHPLINVCSSIDGLVSREMKLFYWWHFEWGEIDYMDLERFRCNYSILSTSVVVTAYILTQAVNSVSLEIWQGIPTCEIKAMYVIYI